MFDRWWVYDTKFMLSVLGGVCEKKEFFVEFWFYGVKENYFCVVLKSNDLF